MSQNNKNKSFSLLNQEEIDVLVEFLTEKKNAVDSDVLSQSSIDKLIMLIQTDRDKLALTPSVFDLLESSMLKGLDFRDDASQLCELRCTIEEETGFLALSVYNTVKKETKPLLPEMLNTDDKEGWGYCMPPVYFNHIAQTLSLKYTKETHDFICSVFAEKNYGAKDHKISAMYLPANDALTDVLI